MHRKEEKTQGIGFNRICLLGFLLEREEKDMGMTMTQKILAAAAGLDKVEAGQLIEANLDLVLGNDITSPVAIKEMDKFTAKGVFDTVNVSGNLPVKMRLPIILRWVRWASSTPCFRKKALP